MYIYIIIVYNKLFKQNMETERKEDNDPLAGNNEIKFDVLKIDSMIDKNEKYEEGDNMFIYCEEYKVNKDSQDPKIDYSKYFAKIKANFEYIGILSRNLKKDSYGFNHFENGDEYFGQWNKDKKEGHGIYYFNSEDKIYPPKELYIGEFKANNKSGEGLYFVVEKFGEKNVDDKTEVIPVDFTLAVGTFSDDYFTNGKICTFREGSSKIYKGAVTKEGKKSDDKGEIYEDKVKIFHGVIKDNIMSEGRIIILTDKDKNNKTAYYFKKEGNNSMDGDISYDYSKGEKDDEEYIDRLREVNQGLKYEKLQDLYSSIVSYRPKAKDFDFMTKLDYDKDVKQKLKKLYGGLLYL